MTKEVKMWFNPQISLMKDSNQALDPQKFEISDFIFYPLILVFSPFEICLLAAILQSNPQ